MNAPGPTIPTSTTDWRCPPQGQVINPLPLNLASHFGRFVMTLKRICRSVVRGGRSRFGNSGCGVGVPFCVRNALRSGTRKVPTRSRPAHGRASASWSGSTPSTLAIQRHRGRNEIATVNRQLPRRACPGEADTQLFRRCSRTGLASASRSFPDVFAPGAVDDVGAHTSARRWRAHSSQRPAQGDPAGSGTGHECPCAWRPDEDRVLSIVRPENERASHRYAEGHDTLLDVPRFWILPDGAQEGLRIRAQRRLEGRLASAVLDQIPSLRARIPRRQDRDRLLGGPRPSIEHT